MSRASLAISGDLIAVALSDAAIVFTGKGDDQGKLLRADPSTPLTSDEAQRSVVSMAFNADGSLLVIADGEKTLRVWDVKTSACLATHRVSKKLTSVAIAPLPASAVGSSGAAEAVLAGDKTGEVWALPLPLLGRAALLLGHTASIVTGLAVYPAMSGGTGGGEWTVASADRDEKVRLSRWPESAVVRGFCLGHTEYVSAVLATTTNDPSSPSGVVVGPLVSISGDGTLRAWHPGNGASLGCIAFSADKEGEEEGEEEKVTQQKVGGTAAAAESAEAATASVAVVVPIAVAHDCQRNIVAVATASASVDHQGGENSTSAFGGAYEVRLLDLGPCTSAMVAAAGATVANADCATSATEAAASSTTKLRWGGSVRVPSAPHSLAFTACGTLLVLCPCAPYLFAFEAAPKHAQDGGSSSSSSGSGSSGTEDAEHLQFVPTSSYGGMATHLRSVIETQGVSVNSALTLTDHDINAKEGDEPDAGEKGGKDTGSKDASGRGEAANEKTANGAAAAAAGSSSSSSSSSSSNGMAAVDPGSHELRKRPIVHPHFDEWNSTKKRSGRRNPTATRPGANSDE